MENIVLVGSSGHAKVIVDILQKEKRYHFLGFLDSYRPAGEVILGSPILGDESILPELIRDQGLAGFLVAIGDNFIRAKVVRRIQDLCPKLPAVSAIHPNASIGLGSTVGAGSVVMAGAVINPCSQVGKHCIVNTNASLDHDSTLGDFASLAPRVVTGGNCHIGEFSAVSIGATLLHGIQVGEHSVVGASSLVTQSIPSLVVAYGTPAKVVRSRQPGDKYL